MMTTLHVKALYKAIKLAHFLACFIGDVMIGLIG